MNLHEMPRSEIEQVINRLYKSEKYRTILRDRIFSCMTYDALIRKHYPKAVWSGKKAYYAKKAKIKKMVTRLKNCGAKMDESEGKK